MLVDGRIGKGIDDSVRFFFYSDFFFNKEPRPFHLGLGHLASGVPESKLWPRLYFSAEAFAELIYISK